jgi:hypothetical protein
MQHDHDLLRRHLAGVTVVAIHIVAICAQSVLLMSLLKDKGKAHWNELEVSALIDYFYQHRSEVGERGSGNFSAETYNAAAEYIASHLSQGPQKTGKMCKMKWASVCYRC